MTRGILVYAEAIGPEIHPVSFELLGKAREIAEKLGLEVWAAMLGFRIKDHAKELIYHGADKVYVYDGEPLKDLNVMIYKDILIKLAREIGPEIFLLGATPFGRSLAPRVAAALDTGLTADCVDLKVDDGGNIIQIRPAFTGNILAHIRTISKPIMSTIRYRVLPMPKRDEGRSGEIVIRDPPAKIDPRMKILGKISKRHVNMADAEVVVSAGRGLKRPEDLKMLGELANLLGGVLGASRPLVDEGWITKDHQVGFSGNTVKPKLYIACGISGSPQHLAGMRDSQIIIAINIDPSAPIFRQADYGVVGDLYEVVPKLISLIKEAKGVGGRS